MATEYYLEEGDTHESLAQELLAQAENPDQVHWAPRPDVHGGGVYLLADAGIAERTRAARQAQRDEDARLIADALAAAKARDEDPDVASGLATPAEAGFPASIVPTEPAEDDADEEPTPDDPATPEDESKMTPAQKRAAAKKAKQEEAAAQAAAESAGEQDSE